MTYVPAEDRYDHMPYRRCGRSGLKLPAISLGLWQNFGDDRPIDTQRAILRRAFDLGITHFDLANNYGPPYGSAEINFGRLLAEDLRPWRDELVISTKAGYDMWPGPYGEWGSRKYLLASLDQSLQRMGLDYVDIFYSHRLDPDTPLEETLGAVDTAVRQGKALYAGISSYSAQRTEEAIEILRDLGTPLLIHQPSYSLLNRWIEPDLLDVLGREGVGAIVFSPLGQGMLTDRYLDGIPEDSRAARDGSLSKSMLSDENLARVRALNEIAQRPRADAGPARAGVDAARPARDLDADRRQQRRAARGQRRRARAPGLRRRRARGDREVRGGRRDQHLGAVELRLRCRRCAAPVTAASRERSVSWFGAGGRRPRARVSSGCNRGCVATVFGDAQGVARLRHLWDSSRPATPSDRPPKVLRNAREVRTDSAPLGRGATTRAVPP